MTKIDPNRLRCLADRFDTDKPCERCARAPGQPHAPTCTNVGPYALPSAGSLKQARTQLRRRADLPDLNHSIASLTEGARVLDADGDLWVITHEGATSLAGQPDREVEWARVDLPEADELFGPFALENPRT